MKLWIHAFMFGLLVCGILSFIVAAQRNLVVVELINSASAWTAVILIGLSMILSGICYFWNAFDHLIIYRKHLGVMGFVYALLHAFISFVVLSDTFPLVGYYLQPENIVSFGLAAAALVYFAFMTVISNNYAVHEMGGVHWRHMLRAGYIAYIFVILHFALKGIHGLLGWSLFFFALFVPYFRMVLQIALNKNKPQV